jgi:acetyl-CoA carboxylase biotin carboxylase subunit
MLKAAGGGGKGMRAVWKDEDLLKAWDGARQECCCFWE